MSQGRKVVVINFDAGDAIKEGAVGTALGATAGWFAPEIEKGAFKATNKVKSLMADKADLKAWGVKSKDALYKKMNEATFGKAAQKGVVKATTKTGVAKKGLQLLGKGVLRSPLAIAGAATVGGVGLLHGAFKKDK